MERCGFFNANLEGDTYDRVYLAEDFADYFASFIGNGVFGKNTSALKVVSAMPLGMKVVVTAGQAWINGYWYENTDSYVLTIDSADGVMNRRDSVVLRLGLAERKMWLAVKKGTPTSGTASAPALTRNADYYDLQLATVYVGAGATNITQANITDTRGNGSKCGWVTGVIDQIDTTNLFAQFTSEFETWFDGVKGQLTTDAAAQIIQNKIDMVIVRADVPVAVRNAKTFYLLASVAQTPIEENSERWWT